MLNLHHLNTSLVSNQIQAIAMPYTGSISGVDRLIDKQAKQGAVSEAYTCHAHPNTYESEDFQFYRFGPEKRFNRTGPNRSGYRSIPPKKC